MTGTFEKGSRGTGVDKRRNAVFSYASSRADGSRQITIGVPAPLFRQLDAEARARDLNNTAFCRRILEGALARPGVIENLLGG
jgi:hypothetical protein